MKAKLIFTEEDYNAARDAAEPVTIQNHTNSYITFGVCGLSVYYFDKNGGCKQKTVNYWMDYSYKALCLKIDVAKFD